MYSHGMDLDEAAGPPGQSPKPTEDPMANFGFVAMSERPRSAHVERISAIGVDSSSCAPERVRSLVCARHHITEPDDNDNNSNFDKLHSSSSQVSFHSHSLSLTNRAVDLPSLPSAGRLENSSILSPAMALSLPQPDPSHLRAKIPARDVRPGTMTGLEKLCPSIAASNTSLDNTEHAVLSPRSAIFPSSPSPSRFGTSMGGLSFSKRKHTPAWPTLPRVKDDRPYASHRALIARSAGLPAPRPIIDKTPTAIHTSLPSPSSPLLPRSSQKSHGSHPYQVYPRTAHPLMPATAPLPARSPAPSSLPPAHIRVKTNVGEAILTVGRTVRLQNVSQAWVVKELNANAAPFWHSPETADCRLVVPCPQYPAGIARRASCCSNCERDSQVPTVALPLSRPGSPSYNGARPRASSLSMGTEEMVSVPQIEGGQVTMTPIPATVFKLHQDYLSTQSGLLRKVLLSRQNVTSSSLRASAESLVEPIVSTLKGASILPAGGNQDHIPVIYLPLPDPASFGLIIHWLYWGEAAAIENDLSGGKVSWKGLVHNIDYLELDDSIKRVVGRWWRKWIKVDRPETRPEGHEATRGHPWPDDDTDDSDSPEGMPSRKPGIAQEDWREERPQRSLGDDADLVRQLEGL